MSAANVVKTTVPKGSISIAIFQPLSNVEMLIVMRGPLPIHSVKAKMKKIKAVKKFFDELQSGLEIVPHYHK